MSSCLCQLGLLWFLRFPALLIVLCSLCNNCSYSVEFNNFAIYFKEVHNWNEATLQILWNSIFCAISSFQRSIPFPHCLLHPRRLGQAWLRRLAISWPPLRWNWSQSSSRVTMIRTSWVVSEGFCTTSHLSPTTSLSSCSLGYSSTLGWRARFYQSQLLPRS